LSYGHCVQGLTYCPDHVSALLNGDILVDPRKHFPNLCEMSDDTCQFLITLLMLNED